MTIAARSRTRLIVHADDLGMARSVNRATFEAMAAHVVSSASVMVPCPWFAEVAAYGLEHRDADIGIHWTVTSEWPRDKWGPVAPRDSVASLLGPDGCFRADAASFAAHARLDEVERELHAQIETALATGLRPTHVDAHMCALSQSPSLAAVARRVARRYALPYVGRGPDGPSVWAVRPPTPARRWDDAYADICRSIPSGTHVLIVHLGHDDAELRAIASARGDWGAAWRARDRRVVMSAAFRRRLAERSIELVGWKDLKVEGSEGGGIWMNGRH